MGIFEDVIINAKSFVGTVGKKAGEVVDSSKLKLAAADLRSEINRKYQILGRLSFEEMSTGKDFSKPKKELFDQIGELKTNLDSLNDMIASAAQKIKCDSCGCYNVKGAIFCNNCGEKLAYPEDASEHMSPDDVIDFTEDNFDDDDLL